MTGKISLTASMRSNLLSLQNISRQVSATQNKLATGNKVNSAIDNPSSYYTARALNNRADDLNALLDSMGQAISTIKAATTALETGATFLEQAAAVATQTLETSSIPTKSYFESQDNVAAVVSNWSELKAALDSGKTGNIVIYGNIEVQDTITLKKGQNLVGVGYYGVNEPETDKFSQLSFDMKKFDITRGIKADADNLTIADISIKAKVKETDRCEIINLENTDNTQIKNLDLIMDTTDREDYHIIGSNYRCAGIFRGTNVSLSGTNSICEIGQNRDKAIVSYAIGDSDIHLYGTLNIEARQREGIGISGGSITTYGDARLNIYVSYRGFQNTICNFNDDSAITINAGYVFNYGEINFNDRCTVNVHASKWNVFRAVYEGHDYPQTINITSAEVNINTSSVWQLFDNKAQLIDFNSVADAQIGYNGKLYRAETAVNDNTMNDSNLPAGFVEVPDATLPEVSNLNWLLEKNAGRGMEYKYTTPLDSSNYDKIINQYDSLIKDSSYKGINLLQDERLNVNFNENRSANLNVQGKDMSSAALGLTTLDWQTQEDVVQAVKEIASALKSIRSFSAELGNNYSIITSRQDFTENLINILTEGADKLTLADMNEESANMLALQTRQQLAINSLSLASQASQSVLRLF